MTLRSVRCLLAACLLSAGTVAPAQNAETTIPPLKHSHVSALLDALRVDQEVALLTDTFWRPAIDALLAANPDKQDHARAFATAARDRERAVYPPLLGFTLDRNLPMDLYPDLQARLRALSDCSGQACTTERATRARKYQQLTAEGEQRFSVDLPAIIKQAASSDAVALRELNRKGLWHCLGRTEQRPSKEAGGGYHSLCAPLLTSPTMLRLQRTPGGKRLIALERTAYVQLAAMIAMAHAAGITLYGLLPPEEVRQAGLQVPPEDLSLEQLSARYAASAGDASR